MWYPVIASAGAMIWIAVLMSLYGPGLSPDSTEYLHMAKEILSGGFRFWSENQAVSHPPFYPAMIAALAGVTGVGVMKAAYWLNVLAAGAMISMTTRGLLESGKSLFVLGGALTFMIFSAPFSEVFSMAWSEIVFIPLVYGALWAVANPDRGWFRAAVVPGILSALALMTRYAGVAVVPVLCLHLLLSVRGGWKKKWGYAVTAGVIPSAMFLAYFLRNLRVSGTGLGVRHASQMGLGDNLRLTVEVFGSWVFWPGLVLGLWIGRKNILTWVRNLSPMLRLWGAFALIHVAFIVWTSTTTAYDPIDTRQLTPALPALLAIFAAWIHGKAGRIAGSVCLALMLWFPARSSPALYRHHTTEGAGGYHTRGWFESELMTHLRKAGVPKNTRVYSNLPDGLYILVGLQAEMSPKGRGYQSAEKTGVTAENLLQRYPGFEGSLWVWFDSTWRDYLLTPEEIEKWCGLERVREFADGVIYRVLTCREGSGSSASGRP